MELPTPYVYLRWEELEANVKAMAQRLAEAGIDHWPHCKTHKSAELVRLQLAHGAKGITAAKLSEAEAMADAGITDILIAYSLVGEEKWRRLGKLAERAKVRTVIDSFHVARGLSEAGAQLASPIEALIEIDGGSHRGGVQPGSDVVQFAREVRGLPGISVVGVFTYVGQIYGSKSRDEIREMARMEARLLLDAQRQLADDGLPVAVLSGGSTPASFYPEELKGMTQSRAGNYIFGDMNAVGVGVMKPEQCALRIRSTVVSTPLPGYATIDAGSKTLTTDLSVKGQAYGFLPDLPAAELYKLNEEHGYIRYDHGQYTLQIGDQVDIIPNHSCVIPNLNDEIAVMKQGQYWKHIHIDARGRNY
ncbi:amino acid processing protein [Paenibacillus thalictri]|uniref:Amino acid processing protein n=2 Tax=Paenibacillus thalictri TaxID=2527873 RepID=A0A4Q9DHW1_9BACL|nr:amino acid processing protein [Paenibacillus thalictri]